MTWCDSWPAAASPPWCAPVCSAMFQAFRLKGAEPGDQVEEREKEDPDDVDQVPVQPGDLHRLVIPPVKLAAQAQDDKGADQQQTNDHVDGGEPVHAEEEDEVHPPGRRAGFFLRQPRLTILP